MDEMETQLVMWAVFVVSIPFCPAMLETQQQWRMTALAHIVSVSVSCYSVSGTSCPELLIPQDFLCIYEEPLKIW